MNNFKASNENSAENIQQKLRSNLQSYAEDSTVIQVVRSHTNLVSGRHGLHMDGNYVNPLPPGAISFRTTFLKGDHERKLRRIRQKIKEQKLPPLHKQHSDPIPSKIEIDEASVKSDAASEASLVSRKSFQKNEVVWENVLQISQYTESSIDQVESIYDSTKPADNDITNHIVRLRDALNWRTMLPRHGPGVRQAMRHTNHKNPLNEILSARKDSGEFVYAIHRAPESCPINPFNLTVVSANLARSRDVYYIVTASSITKCTKTSESNVDSEIHPIIWWLYEQRLYNMICKFSVFVKFRLWKQFNVWKSVIRGNKTSSSKKKIEKSLFVADDNLQRCMLHVRRMCEDICGSRNGLGVEVDAILLFKYDSRKTYKLMEFCQEQEKVYKKAIEHLKCFRNHIVQLALNVCITCAENDGITKDVRLGKVTCKQFPTKRESKLKDTTYAQLAAWRKTLSRLSSFIHLMDELVQEMINRMVMTAMKFFMSFVAVSNHDGKCYISEDDLRNQYRKEAELYSKVTRNGERNGYSTVKAMTSTSKVSCDKVQILKNEQTSAKDNEHNFSPPMFTVKLVLEVPEMEVASRISSNSTLSIKKRSSMNLRRESVVRFGKSVSFPDLSVESVESDDETEIESEATSRRQSIVSEQSIAESPSVVMLSPTKDVFLSSLQEVIDGFESIFSELSLVAVAEELKEFTQSPAFDIQLSTFDDRELSTVYTSKILTEDSAYKKMTANLLSSAEMAFDHAKEYSNEYTRFCAMVDESRLVDVDASLKQQEWTPEDFASVLFKHTDMIREIRDMKPSKRVALLHVDAKGFSKSTLPYPQVVIDATHRWLPMLTTRHNDELLSVIRSATRKLDSNPETVEQFVEHLTFLARTTTEMPALDKEYFVVTRFFTIIKEYGVWMDPEQLAIFQTLVPAFQHLKTTMLFCEAKKDDNIMRFSADLDKHVHNLRYHLFDLKNKVAAPNLLSAESLSVAALEVIKLLSEEAEELSVKAKSYANYQDRFGSSYSSSKSKKLYTVEALIAEASGSGVSAAQLQAELSEVERDITLRKLLWESSDEWIKLHQEWTLTEFLQLNIDSVQENVSRFMQTVFMLEKGLPKNEILPKLKQAVLEFKQGLPLIAALRNNCLKQRHWDEIQYAIGRSLTRDTTLTLGDLLKWRLFQHRDMIMEISTRATNESTLQTMLNKLIQLWHGTDFKLVAHTTGAHTVMIISTAEDIWNQLEEGQVTIATIKGSRYVAPIKGQVEDWERRLTLFSRTLDEWMKCQRNWLYLEPVFTTVDIQRQLPTEAQLFVQVDRSWRELMRRTEDRPNALRAATGPGVLEVLQSCNSNLEKIQKCLEDYLELKRLAFPRFYFLSNDELLSVLSHGRDPASVQPHLVKCFANIKYLDIRGNVSKQPLTVRAMISAEGEVVNMPKNVRARGSVEQWLSTVESAMFDTVRKHLRTALLSWSSISENIVTWMFQHPGQVVLTVAQIMFNRDVTNIFFSELVEKNLEKLHKEYMQALNVLSGAVSAQHVVAHQYYTLEALIIIYVHIRDIVMSLIKGKVASADNFEWTRQLLYEWQDASNICRLVQADARFTYGCEYIGCASRLVITPLTDRCFLTLTGALNLHLGGSPAGPAGTGKSETVKDLAKIMGKQCVVFNCSEGIDFKMMGQFFSGLSQSGSWCCFDEFNRIDVEVLSVIASQVHAIKSAKDAQALRFLFEGREIKLNASCAYFITMNPGYLGRVELPDNLKSLFRPVAMMVPDYALITEIILFSEGFRDAKLFSRKIVNLYELASKQLSQQDHYDFGMRSIKSVLVMAGQKKREMLTDFVAVTDKGMLDKERNILIHSLRNANLPRFLAEDAPLFNNIMSDLFPGITPSKMDNTALEKSVELAINDLGLEKWPDQVQKVIQLHEQLAVRHGVMLVGPSGGGKSTVRSVLQKALTSLYSSLATSNSDERGGRRRRFVESFSINPKCVSLGELYGYTDPNTLEWADGLLAYIVRKYTKELSSSDFQAGFSRPKTSVSFQDSQASCNTPASMLSEVSSSKTARSDDVDIEWRWIILDGPVDTAWVENLNTALDDTKTLCLANGERISLPENMRLMFEVDTLAKASPATISRCAMVYMDPVELGWKPYVKSWLNKLPKDLPQSGKDHLMGMFELSVDPSLQLLDRRIKLQHLPVPHLCVVQTLCRILQCFLEFMEKNGGFGDSDRDKDKDDAPLKSRTSSRLRHAASGSKDEQRTILNSLDKSKQDGKKWYMESHPDRLLTILGRLFVFAFTWSVGGVLNREDDQEDDSLISSTVIGRDETLINMSYDFDHFVHDIFEKDTPYSVTFPSGSKSIFSYFIDLQSGRFVPWDDLVPSTRTLIERGLTYTLVGNNRAMISDHRKSAATDNTTTMVPTTDTIRYSFLSALLLTNRHPVLLTGDSGVGKTALLQNILNKLSEAGGLGTDSGTILGNIFNASEKTSALLQNIASLGLLNQNDDEPASAALRSEELGSKSKPGVIGKPKTGDLLVNTIQFSALTQPSLCQTQFLSKLVKRSRDSLGPARGKKCVAFVNDLNTPASDKHGSQPPLELLRQFLDLGGFYDIKRLSWKKVVDVTIAATAAPPGGGRSLISSRFLKHFSVFAIPQPSTRSLQHIYQVQLGHFLENRDFMPEVKDCCKQAVNASIAVYYKMCNAMLPTPDKCHYTFNLRDLSAVVKGILQADQSVIVSRETTAQLFAHEATRVFHDRLTDVDDRSTFFQFLSDDLHNYFKITIPPDTLQSKPFVFGDFTDMNAPSSTRIYRQLHSHNMLATLLEEYYMRISSSNVNAAPLVFFEAAVDHVIRAARVFRQSGTHMLLVGIDGTGKATTCKLAAKIAGCEVYRLSIVKGYSLSDFREELKKVLRRCGVANVPTVLLLTDADLVSDTFLEDINCILNTGEESELFDHDELDAIVMEVKQAAIASDVPDSRAAMLQFFRRQVTHNLHITIATSPAGGTFRRRCRTHPALVNCCTIDWYDRWPEVALISVACAYFSRENVEAFEANDENSDVGEKVISADKIASVCVKIHSSAAEAGNRLWEELRRRYYTTPTTYLEFVQLFTKMLDKNKRTFNSDLNRLHTGLHKLSEARSLVNIMQTELVGLGPKIEAKAQDTERLMAQLKKDSQAVNEVREIVRQEEATMVHETQLVQDFAQQATLDLQSVLPALQEAVCALDSLDKSDIAELRVYTKPPQLVLTVMNAVCILLQTKADWASAKLLLSDPMFLKRLVQLDRDAIPDKVFAKLRKVTRNSEFKPERVQEVSVACKSMCMWVLALQHYNDVQRMVEPKQRRVKEAREALEVAQENLKQKQASLTKIEDHLIQLSAKYDESVVQREALKERQVLTRKRLERAAVLINALADEEGRWKTSVDNLKKKLGGLVGDTLVSAASVAYLGPFIRSYRHELTSEWVSSCASAGIETSSNYDMIKLMVDDNQVRTWHNQNLPRDVHSTENAVIIDAARRWPLIVDPQGQALNWIKEMEKEKLRIVYAGDPNYMKSVENAIRVGQTLLLYDLEETLDPELRPVLQLELTHRAGQDYIILGGTEVSYNENFKLYLTTSRANPHFLPAVCIAVTIVNFTITFEGLQGQLLSSVVTHERPQLEVQRGELLQNIAKDMALLQELEDKALMLLEKQEGHVLDDEDLIKTLKQSKLTSAEVMERLRLSEENELRTDAARGRYLPVATRGAVLYFVLADLEILNPMYQFSLQWFTDMFIQCIFRAHESFPSLSVVESSSSSGKESESSSSPQSGDVDENEELLAMLQKMIDVLTHGVFVVVSYSLFAEHQIVFSFLLSTAIMRNNARYKDKWRELGQLSEQNWNIFLHSRVLASMTDDDALAKFDGLSPIERLESNAGIAQERSQSIQWISAESWRQCQYIALKNPAFQGLCESLVKCPKQWKHFARDPNPYYVLNTTYLGDDDASDYVFYWTKLASFERLILIKVLRPECLLPSARSFVRDQMGEVFIRTDSFDLNQIYAQSQPTVPMVFILSPGTDPSAQLLRYAKETRGSILHVDMVSLGRGQGPKAEDLIHKAQILKGRWVFLQNCHLAASFMPRLQAIVEELSNAGTDVDPDFRLWLSSKPDRAFPVPILQRGLKMAVEPPRGIRSHLQLAFGSGGSGEVTPEIFDRGSSHKYWKPLLFSLCCFNALAHERQKFGTLGFNLPYDFTSSDLEVSIRMLQQLLGKGDNLPWSAIQHLTGAIVYGGRVTDHWDRRCLLSMLRRFYCDDVTNQSHTYSLDGVYKPPSPDANFAQVRDYVNSLPLSDPPDVFGMHANAERAYMESEAIKLVDVIIQVQPKLTTASVLESGKTDSEVVMEITRDILRRLPPSVEHDDSLNETEREDQLTLARLMTSQVWKNLLSKAKAQDSDENRLPLMHSALLTVARQEIDRFNRLLEAVQVSLRALTRALSGEIVMSDSLEQTFQGLLLQKVPASWQAVSYESCKLLGSWFEDLLQRVGFFAKWSNLVISSVQAKIGISGAKEHGSQKRADSVLKVQDEPTSYWLSAFFFPQGFLTGVLQNYARKHTVPVDTLTFQFIVHSIFDKDLDQLDVTKTLQVNGVAFRTSDTPISDGVRVFGLFLDSARWDADKQMLGDSLTNVRYFRMPEILFKPVQNVENESSGRQYECPLYRTSARAGTLSSTGHSTNFVTTVALETNLPSDHWILRGTALLCQLDQ
ncbi:dynein axonemal heavy chain 6-like [Clavelina lepadiformis]|uniref:dynein axonemal heavy chain 6-like n=1 Tax=Clavelina lepadiformis TaxID=159417 RepID=UPI0040433B8B